ncbi:MAG: PD40 domain-containing protein, partial [Acidobacteriia bacterium]|nr:PD40 domain-containing protein [Terriglobia bacterium]
VLYEMLTGKRLFVGETISDTLASVLKGDIDWSVLPPGTPAPVRHLLRRCLERDRKLRLRDISDARLDLNQPDAPVVTAIAPVPRRATLPWGIAAALALVAAIALAALWRATRPIERPLIQIEADLGPGISLSETNNTNPVILSPDGTRLAFASAGADGRNHLYTRRLNQPKAVQLAGTAGVSSPCFSPDGLWIAFVADGKLKKVQVEGGAAMTLCEAANTVGIAWGEDGNLIAALDIRSGLSLIPSAGGPPKPFTTLTQGELTHRWPQILPGGKAVLFISSARGSYDEAVIEVVSVPDGRRKKLHQGASWSRYVPSGHLLYLYKNTLFAMPFDLGRLEPTGAASPVVEEVASRGISGAALFDVSPEGTAVYQGGGAEDNLVTIQWMDQAGKTEPLQAKPGLYFLPRFSPDGKRIALILTQGGDTDVWAYDWQRDTMTRLTFDPGSESFPVWTPDGTHLFYRNSSGSISWVRSDGATKPVELIIASKERQIPYSIAPDGKHLAFTQAGDIWTVPLEGGSGQPRAGKPEAFLKTTFLEEYPAFSPDGKWLAYSSNETGGREIFVRAFPDSGGKWMISNNGGTTAVWSRSGRDLYYRTLDSRLMVAPYSVNGGSFVHGKPRLLSEKRFTGAPQFGNFDQHPDGKRFAVLMGTDVAEKPRSQVTFLFNFLDELKRRVPPRGGK